MPVAANPKDLLRRLYTISCRHPPDRLTEVLHQSQRLFLPAFLDLEDGNSPRTHPNLIKQRIYRRDPFLRPPISLQMTTLIRFACQNHDPIGPRLKRFDKIRYVHFA